MPKSFTANASWDRVITSAITRTRAVAPVEVRAVFYNGRIDNAGDNGERSNINDITVRAGMERLGATNVLLKWKASGNDTFTLPPSAILVSDGITGQDWGGAAGSRWPLNTFFAGKVEAAGPALGASIPGCQLGSTSVNTGGVTGTRADQQVACTATLGADQVWATGPLTTAGGATNLNGLTVLGYIGIWHADDVAAGLVPAAMGWLGDSIGDDAYPTVNNYAGAGGIFIEKAVRTAQLPFCKIAAGSRKATGLLASNPATLFMMSFMTDLVLQIGINGVNAGSPTGPELCAIYEYVAYEARRRGVKRVHFVTMTPSTSSNNNFLDAAGQTYRTGFGPGEARDYVNARMRATAGPTGPGVDYVIETAATIQNPTDPSKILTNGVANTYISAIDNPVGIHPTEAGHALMAMPLATAMAGWRF